MLNKTPVNSAAKTESAPNNTVTVVILLLLLAALLLFATVIFSFLPDRRMVLAGHHLDVLVADTISERERGLSGRERLGDDQGMLFVYAQPGYYCMWMKDMNFGLDVVWLDDDRRVASIQENISPSTYPESFCPDQDASYMLELNAGSVQKMGIELGQQAKF